jgi:NADH-quinone oxidoreductase subunit M
MILAWLIVIPCAAGLLAWWTARFGQSWPRWISAAALALNGVLATVLWAETGGSLPGVQGAWAAELDWNWIPDFGIRFHLGMDGLSYLLLMLTFVLGILSVLASWREITSATGFFHLNLMWILAGITGVFLALDLFLFYFAWELMIVPMYFLISIWGHERRVYAALKFFIFTQVSGLLMLVAILALYFAHHGATGVYTFQYTELLGTPLDPGTARWIMLGFFVAFAVKLPVFPLHTWLPDAHTEAPTAGSVILAGLMLKTGGYGLMRFVVPLFPEAAREFAPIALLLAVIGILYGAMLAFAQTDLKRLVAYTSVSHLGFVLLGAFAWNDLALSGALMTMLAHGLSTGALFVIVGAIQERIHTRDIAAMGGLWSVAPYMSGAAMFFTMASLGLPGLGDFVGEILVLAGTYPVAPWHAVLAAIGVLASTFYGLKLIQRAFHGPNVHGLVFADLRPREALVMAVMIGMLIWLGVYPQPVLRAFEPSLQALQRVVESGGNALR